MNWLGQGASAHGNVIQLANGGVGVTAACSGIRSFQTACMLAIFFGELYRLSAGRRGCVLILGLTTAIALNVFRALTLTWVCAEYGPDVESAWHDRVGMLSLGLMILSVWLIGSWATRWRGSNRSIDSTPDIATPQLHGWTIPSRAPLLVLAWLLAAEVGVQAWYRGHELGLPAIRAAWSIKWPAAHDGFQQKILPDETRKLLRCDESQTGRWLRPDGAEWTLFFFRWRPGRMAAQLAKGHTPDVCLPANGFKQMADRGYVNFQVHGMEIPFHAYVFALGERRYHVFFCQVDDRPDLHSDSAGSEHTTYLSGLEPDQRLRAVREGRRHAGHQVLEIALTGYATAELAQAALQTELPHLIQPGK
jgi:exosortase/archaeosortase family protein